jgi:hypothetical protein
MKNFVPLSLAALTVAFMWFVAWLGGYNFDERTFLVGWWAIVSVFVGGIVFFAVKGQE